MHYVLIIHEVEDYLLSKKGFDEAAVIRKQAGEIEFQVLKYEEDPNRIVHFSRWRSLREAKLFFESDEVEKIRAELGVKRPEFVYLNQEEVGFL